MLQLCQKDPAQLALVSAFYQSDMQVPTLDVTSPSSRRCALLPPAWPAAPPRKGPAGAREKQARMVTLWADMTSARRAHVLLWGKPLPRFLH